MTPGLLTRVETREGVPVLKQNGAPVADLIARLQSGQAPAEVAGALGLEPADLIAGLAFDALGNGTSDDDGPPLVQSRPRRPGLERALDDAAMSTLFPRAGKPNRLGLAAGLLQIHDFWEASHDAAQQADDLGERSVSAYWHGIAHRREPDPGNAAYWFRRVGKHAVFGPLTEAVRPVIADSSFSGRLTPGGHWDPFAFIDLCGSAKQDDAMLAREIQRLEMLLLLEASLPG